MKKRIKEVSIAFGFVLFFIAMVSFVNADPIIITSPLNGSIVTDFGGGGYICVGLGDEVNRSNATCYVNIGNGNFSFSCDWNGQDDCVEVILSQLGEYNITVYVEDGVVSGSDTITIKAIPSGWSSWEIALAIIFGILFFTLIFGFVNLNCCESDKPLQIFFLILAFLFLTLSSSLTLFWSEVRIIPSGIINLLHTSYIISLWILLMIIAYIIITFLYKILINIKLKKEKEKSGEWEKW